jgi:hypothetical protein
MGQGWSYGSSEACTREFGAALRVVFTEGQLATASVSVGELG